MNYLQDFITRVKADWKEWTTYQKISWVERFKQRRAKRDVIRDQRMIDAALERARIKNVDDHKTYYIMKDKWGGINEINKEQLDKFTRAGIFPKMNYLQRVNASIAIVTSNKNTQRDFDRVQENKKKAIKDKEAKQ
jgi:hypothetical protein